MEPQSDHVLLEELAADEVDQLLRRRRSARRSRPTGQPAPASSRREGTSADWSPTAQNPPRQGQGQSAAIVQEEAFDALENSRDIYAVELPENTESQAILPPTAPSASPAKAPAPSAELGFEELLRQAEIAKANGDTDTMAAHVVGLMGQLSSRQQVRQPSPQPQQRTARRAPQPVPSRSAPPSSTPQTPAPQRRRPQPTRQADPLNSEPRLGDLFQPGDSKEVILQRIQQAVRTSRQNAQRSPQSGQIRSQGQSVGNLAEELLAEESSLQPTASPRPVRRPAPAPASPPSQQISPVSRRQRKAQRRREALAKVGIVALVLAAVGMTGWILFGG